VRPEARSDTKEWQSGWPQPRTLTAISVENMRGWLLAEGLVMVKYTSENHGRRSNRTSLWRCIAPGQWQVFHHQGTITTR
jgi:hypothetical protein